MTRSSLEDRRVRSTAQDYRDKGYKTVLQPVREELPDFLAAYTPDLYAENGEDHVVVIVKTRASLAKSRDLVQLAEALHHRPGWRLELVVTNPKQDWPEKETVFPLLNESEIAERFQQVEALQEQDQFDCAMLLAWTATEATLRQLAQRHNIKLKEQSSNYIIKQLFSLGILDRSQFNTLDHAIRFRDAIIHGFRLNQIEPWTVQNLIDTARNLLRLIISPSI
jgi:uncharacterized protein YutE (UPF0331/DUF86 family)